MNKLLLPILVVAIGAGVFAVRYRSLRALNAERERLHNTPPQPATPATNPSVHNDLSEAERNELLRLRGQIGVLLRELTEETKRLNKMSAAQNR